MPRHNAEAVQYIREVLAGYGLNEEQISTVLRSVEGELEKSNAIARDALALLNAELDKREQVNHTLGLAMTVLTATELQRDDLLAELKTMPARIYASHGLAEEDFRD